MPGPMVICQDSSGCDSEGDAIWRRSYACTRGSWRNRTHSCASDLIARDGTLASEQNLQLMAQRIGIDQRLDALQGTRIMDTDRKLGEIAANLDDMSHTLAALKNAVETGGRPSGSSHR